jgi:hypothetical protein
MKIPKRFTMSGERSQVLSALMRTNTIHSFAL